MIRAESTQILQFRGEVQNIPRVAGALPQPGIEHGQSALWQHLVDE